MLPGVEKRWLARGLVFLLPLGICPHPGSAGVQDRENYYVVVFQFKFMASWCGEYLVNRLPGL